MSTKLFNESNASQPFLELLQITQVNHDGSLNSIRDGTQKLWRKTGQHSGDIEDANQTLFDQCLPLFEELGFVGEVTPSQKNYEYVLVAGAYQMAVRKRLHLVKQASNHGLDVQKLVLLGGMRKFNPEKESLKILNAECGELTLVRDIQVQPQTEAEVMDALLHHMALPRMWSMPGFYTLVNTPLRTDRPEKPDPSAEDTLVHWINNHHPDLFGKKILVVYSQPAMQHMQVMCDRIFAAYDCEVECVGYAYGGKTNVSQTLDSMAKVIYELAR